MEPIPLPEKAKIIVVDDDPIVLKLIQGTLSNEGYEIYTARTGREALEIIEESSVDMLITDIRMPEMDGIQLIEEVKKIIPEILIIVITGYSEFDSAIESLKKGVYDYIVKPIDPDLLIAAVSRGWERQRLAVKNRQLILDLKQVNEALQAAKSYTESIIQNLLDTLILVDTEGKVKTVNRATCHLLGYTEEELVGMPVSIIFAEEEEEEEEEDLFKGTRMKRLIQEGSVRDYDMTYQTRSGERIPVSFSGSVMYETGGQMAEVRGQPPAHRGLPARLARESVAGRRPGGRAEDRHQAKYERRIIGIVGIARDMREIKRLMQKEKEFAEAEAAAAAARAEGIEVERRRLEYIFESMVDGVAIIDFDGIVRHVNGAFERITGWKKEKVIGESVVEIGILPQKEGKEIEEQVIPRLMKEGVVRNIDATITSKDGRESPVLMNWGLMRDAQGRMVGGTVVIRDITELKRAQDGLKSTYEKLRTTHNQLKESQSQVIQSEKMGALGTMTAGVAHEMNNPMMSILNYMQYCIEHTSNDDRKYRVLQHAEREVNRCIGIVRNLLTFSHKEREGQGGYQEESCADILDTVLKLCSYRIDTQGVSIKEHIAEGIPKIWMNVNNIQQVFLNLINNAMGAVEVSENKEISVEIEREEGYVRVTIADKGCGIAPENLQKVFDPFFTTKPTGKGTGLGLSICSSIVQAHGGKISCESEPGAGTMFKVLLPIERRKT